MTHIESALGMGLLCAGVCMLGGVGPALIIAGVLILIDRLTD